jgi:CheY-like chemotaxis protein
VNPSSINNWVRAGRIVAFRTPGGHLRIRARDLIAFLREHEMPIPERLNAASRRRLLLVDDDPRQLRAYKRVFKSHADRVDVMLVDNGVDALVQVGAFRPDLIVLDVFMGDLDGLEVTRRLKSNAETRHMEIIVTSANLTHEIEQRALKLGAKSCIHKPIPVKRLLEELGLERSAVAGRL